MYSVGNVSSKESTWADQGRVRKNNADHPTRSLVEMVPRQPDVDYEDSITTEQRVRALDPLCIFLGRWVLGTFRTKIRTGGWV